LLTRDVRVIEANDEFTALVGRTPEQLAEEPPGAWLTVDSRERITTALARAEAGDECDVAVGVLLPNGAQSDVRAFVRRVAVAGARAAAVTTWQDQGRALADQQAALRRVATLVARGVAPEEVFNAVTAESTRVLGAAASGLFRYEPNGMMTLMAHDGRERIVMAVGDQLTLDGSSAAAKVRRTGRPARIESYATASGEIADMQRTLGYRGAVGAPIVVEGRLWGVITSSWPATRTIPTDSEERLGQFTELAAMAIANSESRSELAASRERIVLAGDDARRRIQRDLHDGAQQLLVSLALELRSVQAGIEIEDAELAAVLTHAVQMADQASRELQELSRGLHPAALSHGGLEPALEGLVRRSPVPVRLSVALADDLPESLKIAVYYTASEALTNAAKHARASVIELSAATTNGHLELSVVDDGVGGADPSRGSGLTGLRDRIEALGGTLSIVSSPGKGTRLVVRLAIRP
jgi:signal transduction histidine kinase